MLPRPFCPSSLVSSYSNKQCGWVGAAVDRFFRMILYYRTAAVGGGCWRSICAGGQSLTCGVYSPTNSGSSHMREAGGRPTTEHVFLLLPRAVLALIVLARRVQPSLSFGDDLNFSRNVHTPTQTSCTPSIIRMWSWSRCVGKILSLQGFELNFAVFLGRLSTHRGNRCFLQSTCDRSNKLNIRCMKYYRLNSLHH